MPNDPRPHSAEDRELRKRLDEISQRPARKGNSNGWHPTTVRQIIRNTTYIGDHQDVSGKTIHECTPIIGAGLFTQAGEALTNRLHKKRGPVNEQTRAMLSGVVFCMRCSAPMYRIKAANKRVGGVVGTTNFYYRCAGIKGRNSNCVNMVRLDDLDAMVSALMEKRTDHIIDTRPTPGHDYADDLAKVQFKLKTLAAQYLMMKTPRPRTPSVPGCVPSRSG